MTRATKWIVLGLAITTLGMAAFIFTFAVWPALRSEPEPDPAGMTAGAAAPSSKPTSPKQRVADLMKRADCKGSVIGTQLYSYETGRCQLSGAEVTIAVFDSAELRDRWVDAGREFGGTFAVGDGWAAFVEKPDAAKTVAGRLGGKVI